jgi:hypothetical protein
VLRSKRPHLQTAATDPASTVAAGAIETLAVLQEQQVPFILLSNGSGTTEESKAAHYSEVLGLPIREDQIQDANTPMRALAEKHRDDLVVIVGKRGAADLAESYGFNNAGARPLPLPPPPPPPLASERVHLYTHTVAMRGPTARSSLRAAHRCGPQ